MKRQARIKLIKQIHKQADFSITNLLLESLSSYWRSIADNPIAGISQLLLEGVIFMKFGWAGAIIATILDKGFGINIKSLFKTIHSVVIPFLTSNQGKEVNPESASSQLTNDVMAKLNVSPEDKNKTFGDVSKANPEIKTANSKLMIKQAQVASAMAGLTLGSLIKGIIKALLIGSAFSVGGEATVSAIKGQNVSLPDNTVKTPLEDRRIDTSKTIIPHLGPSTTNSNILRSYDNNADKNEKSGGAFHIISSGNFEDMIHSLIFTTYPKMPDKIETIINNNFERIIPSVKTEFINWNPKEDIDIRGTYVRVPTSLNGYPMKSLKDIVDATLSLIKIK